MGMKKTASQVALLAAVIVLLLSSTAIVVAHSGATGVVKERMDLMKRYDELVDRLFAVAHGEIPHSETLVRDAAAEIKTTSGEHLTGLFPPGSTEKPSVADPKIWENREFFDHMAERLQDFAAALESAASTPPSNPTTLPAKWEEVPAMGGMMGGGGMMQGGGMGGGGMMGGGMMGGQQQQMMGNPMEQTLWRVAHVCNTCHTNFRLEE